MLADGDNLTVAEITPEGDAILYDDYGNKYVLEGVCDPQPDNERDE